MQNEYDDWNRARKHFNEYLLQTITSIHPWIMGIGIPYRHPSYILGR